MADNTDIHGTWVWAVFAAETRHCFTYICPPNGSIQRPNPVRYVQYECAMKQLRGPKHENWPVCDPRAAPPGEYGLKSGENGHANGAIDVPYCAQTWLSVFGRQCEPLAGQGGGFGWLSCTSAHTRRLGRFFNSSGLVKCAGPGRPPLWRKAWPGWLSYAPCSREGQGEQNRCFSQPASRVKCARRTP
jgi:hypothetical protein